MTQDTSIARREPGGQLATEAPANPFEGFQLLTPYRRIERPARMSSLATISAGYRGQNGFPVVSRDGTIHVQDDANHPAKGLRAALAAASGKRLTIAFGSNDPRYFMQQRLTTYSQTRLEAWGDHEQITITDLRDTGRVDKNRNPIMEPVRRQILKATHPTEYEAQKNTMKAETFLFFYLARWREDGSPEIYFPDGVVTYRLRFTSVNSADSLIGAITEIARNNGGQFAGLPLDLYLTNQNRSDGSGMKRNVPIWMLSLDPPEGFQDAASLPGIRQKSFAQAAALALPPPEIVTVDQLALDGPAVDPEDYIEGTVVTDQDMRVMREGGPIPDPRAFMGRYMRETRGSSIHDDEGRHDFIRHFTGGRFESLSAFTAGASAQEGERLQEAAMLRAIEERSARDEPPAPRPTEPLKGRSYGEMFPGDDLDKPAPVISREMATPKVEAAVAMSGGPVAAPAAPEQPQEIARPEPGVKYSRVKLIDFYTDWFAALRRLDTFQKPIDIDATTDAGLIAELKRVIAEVDSLEEFFARNDDPPVGPDDDAGPLDVPVAEEEAPMLVDAF